MSSSICTKKAVLHGKVSVAEANNPVSKNPEERSSYKTCSLFDLSHGPGNGCMLRSFQ